MVNGKYFLLELSLVIYLLPYLSNGQFKNCDYFQQLNAGQTYPIFSPGYPSNYIPGSNCLWQAQAPPGYKINVNCNVIQLPPNIYGNLDRIAISYSGDPTLANAQIYTTNQSFAYSSYGNNIVIGLRSSIYSSNGGKFLCYLTATGSAIAQQVYCNCGQQIVRYQYVSGVLTPLNQYSSIAGLVQNGRIVCGATIIANYYAITAAHCVNNQNPQSFQLLVGEQNYQYTTSPTYSGLMQVSAITINPAYVASSFQNDIAIVQTASNMLYNTAVVPACLPFSFAGQNNTFINYNVNSVGWVTTSYFNNGWNSVAKLQQASMTIVSNAQCNGYLPVIYSQMCEYTAYNSTCQMSTGGPIFFSQNQYTYVIGVTSFQQGCNKVYPGSSTRVTSFINWITNNTPGANYCYK